MARALTRSSSVQVWPAFTDAMLAFVLVLVLLLAYQVGSQIDIAEGPDQQQVLQDQERVEEIVEGIGLDEVKVTTELGRQQITFGSGVLFDSGSPDLSETGRGLIQRLAQNVSAEGLASLVEIQVGGHTDTVPTNRPDYTNLELSADRATNVVRSLIASGIDPDRVRISATGYGEHVSVDTNESEAGRQRNRRIEVRLVYQITPAGAPADADRP